MFSLFQNLLSYQLLVPFLLRLTLGSIFCLWAYGKLKTHKNNQETTLGIIEALVGISLIIGLFTQLSALIAAIILTGRLYIKIQKKAFLTDGVNYYLILLIMSICLLISGAGFIAFDLPL